MNNKNAATHSIDAASLQQWLSRHFGGAGQLTLQSIRIPGNGYSALTALLDVEIARGGEARSQHWVLRLEKQGRHIFLDTDIARQGQMMTQLARRGLPAPNVLATESDAAVLGGKFLLMDRIDGVSLPQNPNYHGAGLLPRLSAERRRHLWCDAITTIAAINKLDWRDGFEFLDKPQYGAPGLDQYLAWISAWRDEATAGKPNPIIDAALNHLLRAKPANGHVDVLWGDSNPGNFLFSESGDVAAVLDFEASALGPAEIDLGWWFFVDGMISFGAERLPGLPERAEIIALFETALGRGIAELPYYELLGALRMALVIARSANLLIENGRLAADNKTPFSNPATHWLALQLNLPGAEPGADFAAFIAAMNE